MYPRRSLTTHTEQLGDEASVYDWAHGQVHALNPTATCVWRQCDGETSRDAIAAVLRAEMGIPEAEAVVDLTLAHLARLQLLEHPVESRRGRSMPTRRWLIRRGLTAAALPTIFSIVAPAPVDAQSGGAAGPTLTSITPNQGIQGITLAVILTGTNFVVGATTVTVSGSGVTVGSVVVASSTSLTANFVIDFTAATGGRTVTVTTTAGTSSAQAFTVNLPTPGAPTLTSVNPSQGLQGATVAVTLTGTNFVVGATTVTVGGGGVSVTNVVVGSRTSLTANFVLDPAAATGARTVAVTTASGTSGSQIFTVSQPALAAPTLISVTPNQGIQGTTVAVVLTGTNFIVGATTVNVSGSGVTVTNIAVTNRAVTSGTSLTATFALDPAAATGARSVTVTTAAGTSGAQTFTITPPPGPGTPTLTSVSPNQGLRGTTVAVTLTGTNFVVGATTVNVSGGVTVNTVVVGSSTSLTANFVVDPAAAVGPRTVTVTTAGGTSGPQGFIITLAPPTLTSVTPNQGIRGATVAVTLTGTNFVIGATTVAVAGGSVTVTNTLVGSSTSLTASFVLDLAAAAGPRSVTVTTAGGTSAAQPFTVTLPAPGSTVFNYTGGPQTFVVPVGVISVTILATGASASPGFGAAGGTGGLGGRTTATVAVTPGASLTVLVGGQGIGFGGGFNGGGGSTGLGGGGGGASSVRDGATPLVVVGGGGGGGAESGGVLPAGGNGAAGGGLLADSGQTPPSGGGGGGGGTQAAGGTGGARSSLSGIDGTAGASVQGGIGGYHQPGIIGGGGGGGGYFGGGGGGGGNPSAAGGGGGGGGSSFAAPSATAVLHEQGVKASNGFVTISW